MNLLNPKVSLFSLRSFPSRKCRFWKYSSANDISGNRVSCPGVVYLFPGIDICRVLGSRIMGIPNAGKYVNWLKLAYFNNRS
jgi:hypothetical protein